MFCTAIERYITVKIIEELNFLTSPEALQIDVNLAVGFMCQ